MERRELKDYAKGFQWRVLASWLIMAVLFAACMVFQHFGYGRVAEGLAIVWAIFSVSFFAGTWWRLRHVRCPTCNGKTIASIDNRADTRIATCPSCRIEWDLGIGTGSN